MATRWKKNSYRKIPPAIRRQLDSIDSDIIRVACIKIVSPSDFDQYIHLGLGENIEHWSKHSPILPRYDTGLHSKRNQEGWEVVRKDLPKVTKTWTTEHPNFGDASTYGYNYRDHTAEVYQKEYFDAPGYRVNVATSRADSDDWTVEFSINRLLDRSISGFDSELLFAINLLQENVGASRVYSSDASPIDLAKEEHISWEIFPEGTADELIKSFGRKGKVITDEQKDVLTDRVELLNRLSPKSYVTGSSGFGSYFGAVFRDNLVMFENLNYGNAIYILFEDWKDVSQMSRYDLLKGTDNRYHRIIHSKGWQRRLLNYLNEKMS